MEKKRSAMLFKRVLSLALAFVLLLGMMPMPRARAAEGGTELYLVPNDNWLSDGARFAMYYFGDSGDGWADMEDSDDDGVWEGVLPDGYDNVIFCRMDPETTENNWDNKWNQTADLTVPSDGSSCYTVAEGAWDKGDGAWSVFPEEEPEPSEDPTEESSQPPAVEEAYFVAGSAGLCGSEWNPGDAANQMEKYEDGIYRKEYSNIPAGRYEFKVTDGTWSNSWGKDGGNYVFDLETECHVTIFFDPETKGIFLDLQPVPAEPAVNYYLFGYINGANYGCEEDSANLGEYKFVDGTVKATFTADSYVAVKTDTDLWYMTDGWQGNATSVTLYDTALVGATADKLMVPAGQELTFTLAVNDDGTLTLSYTAKESGGEEVPEDIYIVAGDSALCGSNWDAGDPANKMEKQEDGSYQKVYSNVPAGTYNLKVTDGTWSNAWGDNGQNYIFVVSAPCDVTVSFDPATTTVTVSGDNVGRETGLEIVSISAVGNGSGTWLNGANWEIGNAANHMTEVSDKVYEITYEKVPEGSGYQFKFAANDSWTHSWGIGGAEGEAVYNGQNIPLTIPYTLANVTLRLDLTGYDHSTKTGATYSVTITEAEAEPVVEYYMVGHINGADYGCEGDYENLGQYKFVNGKLMVTFEQDSYIFLKTGDNASWFMFQTYTDTQSGTLYNTTTGASEKMFVPGGKQLEFTLTVNEDGTLTLVYAIVQAPEGGNSVTLHFFKPETWGEAINAYLWATGAVPGYEAYNTWPGKAIEANAEHAGWYDLVVTTETPMAFNFIFNDGGNQTADLATGEVTGDTELWIVGNTVSDTAPGEWSGDYDYTANLYFFKPGTWGEAVYAYLWTDGGAISGYEEYNTWPGKAVEPVKMNDGWYTVSVTMEENTGFNYIFNDGAGNQTADLVTGVLEVTTNLWVLDGAASTTEPAGWKDPNRTIHVPGTFPGPSWDAASNTMTYDPELGLYVYTFENVPPANYEYKISVNGSWNENYGAGGVPSGSNIAVAVTETMDVTIYYNDETHNSVTSVNYIFADVTLSGTGIPEGTKLTDAGLTGIYSVTVPMTAGTYEDLVITCEGKVYAFDTVEVKEDKDIAFYMDPITGIFYCDASQIPVDAAAIRFDSQDVTFKYPFGAVATGEAVTFAIETGKDVTSAVLVVKGLDSVPMEAEETETGKRWTGTTSFSAIGEYDYYFSLSNGSSVAIYSDDDGYYGLGQVCDLTQVKPYDLVVYEAGFETPGWMKDAVIYQIFPDRFFDGDITNNQAQFTARGAVNYEYINDWYTIPENPEQEAMLDEATYKSTGAYWGDGEWSNEIYGGDLEGITQRIGYLKALGVNVIYLNPVFSSISSHRYDACDYMTIDPILGDLGDFRELVRVAEANDMHIILDGVFNHVSDDSVYFDRYYKFLGKSQKIGAYPYWAYVYDYMAEKDCDQTDAETAAKAYFTEAYGITDYSYTEWFEVYNRSSGSVDTIGQRIGKDVYAYDGWWGYDSMPIIYATNGSEYQTGNWAQEIIYNSGNTSVTQYWIAQGNNGWRLDVANEVSDETWQRFRDSVKALDSDAVIIGEIWDDATKYLKGDMYDSVMNYLFRNAVTEFAMGTGAEETTLVMEKIRERYPAEAFYAMMNLVGSHDTTRILSYLDGIGDDRKDTSLAAAFPTYAGTSDTAKARQYLVAFLQFTYAGAPTIYYGDEIGMVGADDPDDRRAMEWGMGQKDLVEWYAKLAAIREAYPALRTGSVEPLDLENDSLLAYMRRNEDTTVTVIASNSAEDQTAALPGTYVDLITGETFTDTVTVPGYRGAILVAEESVKTVTVNTAALAPAYDPAYLVPARPAGIEIHTHTYEASVTVPTCTETGYITYTCTLCGYSYVGEETAALGHAYEAVVIEPTCIEGGYTIHTCPVCQDSYTDAETEALGHAWDQGTVTQEPSAEAPGVKTYECTRCHETYTTELAMALAEGVGTTLFGGKSLTLKAVDLCTGKTLSSKKVRWTMPEEFAPYASLSQTGKLTAKKVCEQISVDVVGTLLGNEKAEPILHTVILYPTVTQLEVTDTQGSLVNSKTVTMDVSEKTLTFIAAAFPADTLQRVTWTDSDKKDAYAEYVIDGNQLTIQNPTGKTGTVTIKATIDAGTKKTVSFKVKFGSYAETLQIDQPETTTLRSGESIKLTASVTPETVTTKGITWKLADTADKACASVSSSGKVTAKKVSHPAAVTILAISKDGQAQDTIRLNILPKTEGTLVLKNGEAFVTGKTLSIDAGSACQMAAFTLTGAEAAAETVTWSSSKTSVATVDETGLVNAVKAGTAKITATAEDGRKATVTLKVKTLVKDLELTTKDGKNLTGDGKVYVASGKSVTLVAKVLTSGASKSVTWTLSDGTCGKISSSGKFTAAKNLTSVRTVTATATAKDGSGYAESITIQVLPLSQGVQIFEGKTAVRSNTVLVWDMVQMPTLNLSAKVFPALADQNVVWSSSSKKVASVDENGTITCLKAGTVTITAKAADGSGQKATFKLTVVKKMTGLTLKEGAVLEVVEGKSLNLSKLVDISPSDTTNRKLTWSVADNDLSVTITSGGTLKTKKGKTGTVTVTAAAQDGSGHRLSFDVTVKAK